MIIDLHTHVVPDVFPDGSGRESAGRWPSMDRFEPDRARVMIAGKSFRTVTNQCWSVERRLGDIVQEGVDRQVISPMPELFAYWFSPADGLDMCRYVNDFIVKLVAAAPDRFYGLGQVPLQDPDLAAKELSRVKKAGLHGIEIGSNILGASLGEPRFLPFFQEVERLDLPVFVHALHPTMRDRIVGPAQLENHVGFPTDTGLTVASLITGQVIERCPELRLAFSHGGGTFPFFLPRLENGWSGRWNGEPRSESFDRAPATLPSDFMPQSPTTYARKLYYDTLLFDRRAIRYLLDMVGASQLVVGTDYPFVPREQPVGRSLLSLDLDEADVQRITWGNCLRFLGVEEQAPG